MIVKETTSGRKFAIELNELELAIITSLLGTTNSYVVRQNMKYNSSLEDNFPKYTDEYLQSRVGIELINNLYSNCLNAITGYKPLCDSQQ